MQPSEGACKTHGSPSLQLGPETETTSLRIWVAVRVPLRKLQHSGGVPEATSSRESSTYTIRTSKLRVGHWSIESPSKQVLCKDGQVLPARTICQKWRQLVLRKVRKLANDNLKRVSIYWEKLHWNFRISTLTYSNPQLTIPCNLHQSTNLPKCST